MGRNEYTYKNGYNGTLQERMDQKTIKAGPNECWLWTGSLDTPGYGHIRIQGKLRRATHIAYELHHGVSIPAGIEMMHTCDNPPCVNPRHLVIGDKLMNMRDKIMKGRANHPGGAQHPMAKLGQSEVDDIRAAFSSGKHTFTSLAETYGVNRTTISRIISGKNWSKTRHKDGERD